VLVQGCAATDTAERLKASGAGSEGGDPQALGVDVVDWPTTVAGASRLLTEMPTQIAGVRGGSYPRQRPAVAQYGEEYYLELNGPSSVGSALETLSLVGFGLGFPRCVAGTYAGTIPSKDGARPDPSRKPPAHPAWFSCRLAPTGRTFMGHAVGWVSGDVGWLALARTRGEVRALVRALIATVETGPQG
jgi:hypothetical protein